VTKEERMAARRIVPVWVVLAGASAWGLCGAAYSNGWKTGPALAAALESEVGATWSGIPLRTALEGLSHQTNVAMFLDRRVDPDQPIEFQFARQPLRQLLGQLADALHLGVCRIEDVVYIGPRATTDKLPTLDALLKQQVSTSSAPIARKLAQRGPLRWAQLTTPQELIDAWSRETQVTLRGAAEIPHDLWPEVDLPQLTAASRLAIILAGFGRTATWDASAQCLVIETFPQRATLERTYRRHVTDEELATLQSQLVDARLERRDGQLVLSGRLEDHVYLEQWLNSNGGALKRPQPRPGKTVYTLSIENTAVGSVLKTLEQRAGLMVHVREDVTADQLQTRVTFSVRDASLEELLQKTLLPAGLTYTLKGGVVEVFPRPG
jgi:hypothetical protein